MKIAILYSGALRNLAETIDNNLSLFPNCEIDLYFSTWEHMGYSERINSPDYIPGSRVIPAESAVSEGLIRSLVPKKCNIKNIKIEKYEPTDYRFDLKNGLDNEGLAAQYYKIKDCYDLLDSDIEYDLIVRLRCDVLFTRRMNVERMKEIVDAGRLIFTDKIWYNHSHNKTTASINEMFWIGKGKIMRKACSIYDNADKINEVIDDQKMVNANYGESICWMNLYAQSIEDEVEIFDFDYRVLR